MKSFIEASLDWADFALEAVRIQNGSSLAFSLVALHLTGMACNMPKQPDLDSAEHEVVISYGLHTID